MVYTLYIFFHILFFHSGSEKLPPRVGHVLAMRWRYCREYREIVKNIRLRQAKVAHLAEESRSVMRWWEEDIVWLQVQMYQTLLVKMRTARRNLVDNV